MSISIVINTETAAEAIAQMKELLGADLVPLRGVSNVKNDAGHGGDPTDAEIAERRAAVQEAIDSQGLALKINPNGDVVPTRIPGQPSPGAKRRTKAEIAEDEAAALAAASEWVAAEPASISTGDERVGPEDDAATVEQDEADEAAETEAAVDERPADKKLTHDDVRNALGGYVKLYGMAAAQEDGPKVIALALKNPEIVKVSAIPETQEALGAVVAGVEEMSRVNPFKRAKVA